MSSGIKLSTTNHKILIAHEAPISMLKWVEHKTDYQYALVHLFENEAYKNYFLNFLSRDGRVILDNSIFELGTAFDVDTFAKHVAEIKPTEYIIPDAFNDMVKTVEAAHTWDQKYRTLPGRKIGVLQGENWQELLMCYKMLCPLVDKIAINFNPLKMDKQDILHWEANRFAFLRYLYDPQNAAAVSELKPLHLLGCSLPQGFEMYKSAPFRKYIETLDTSNPVLLGLIGSKYAPRWGVLGKPDAKMDEFMNEAWPYDVTLSLIEDNISMFKDFVNGPSVY